MAYIVSRSNAYNKFYSSQLGGNLDIPVFAGGQHGAGLGDILRGVLRFVAPIALKGITTFATNTIRAHDQGSTLKDAAVGALRPSLNAMVQAAVNRQQGNGHAGSGDSKSAMFAGDQGIPFKGVAQSRVYKEGANKRKHVATKRKKTVKKAKHDVGFNF